MITLHIYLRVTPGRANDLMTTYRTLYVSAISKQRGFHSAQILRTYDAVRTAEIDGRGDWDHEIDITFDSEENRRLWVASPEHVEVWPRIAALCDQITWQGFDVLG